MSLRIRSISCEPNCSTCASGNTTKELQNSSKIRLAKRDLARVLTVIGEKR